MVVHFPIALLLAALLTEALALLLRKPSLHLLSLWNCGLGVLGAGTAVLTGRAAMAAAKHSMEIFRIMEIHERLGYAVLALSAAAFLGRVIVRDHLTTAQRRAAFALLAVACGLMVFSAHLGGRMVYEYGVGGIYGRSMGGMEIVQ